MYVMVQNMDELSTFFKRQVLLSRFIAQFSHGEFADHKYPLHWNQYFISLNLNHGVNS